MYKYTLVPKLLFLLVVTLAISCNRSMNHPSPTPTGGIAINLTYPESNPAYGKQIELIIDVPGGAILMDSMIRVNTPLVTTLHTNQKLVDVTTVVNDSSAGTIYVTTWQAVDPTGWTTPYPNGYNILNDNTTSSPASLYYTKIPYNSSPDMLFAADAGGSYTTAEWSYYPSNFLYDKLNITYNGHSLNRGD